MNQILRCWVVVFSVFIYQNALAQEKSISGTVTSSEDGSAMPGVSISVKGTSKGTSTDGNGKYKISVPQNSSLVFSFVGMESQQVKVGNASIIDVKLKAIASELNEVVVTSFNISKDKKTLGYATQQVNGDEIAETQRENFLTALQSRVAGATINTTSGAPGASSQIVLRGFNSLSGNNSPLIVVDGLPISNSTFDQNNLTVQGSNRSNDFTNRAADINPNDIASITVLKGPEATSLYGIDAGSGAIIITTKKGAAGKLKVSYDNSFRIDHMYLYPEIQTTYGLGVLGDGAQRTRSALGPKISDTTKIYNNVKNFFNDAFVQKHNVTLDGGKNRLAYRLSLGSTNQNGTIPNTGLDRYNARGTLSYNSLRKNFDANLSLAYTYSENQKALRGAGGFLQGLYSWPIFDDASQYIKEDGARRRYFDDANFAEADNPYWSVNKNESSDKTNRYVYNLSATYRPMPWLTVTGRGGLDSYQTNGNLFFHPLSNDYYTVGGMVENYTEKYKGYSGVMIATAEKKVGKLTNTLRLGSSFDEYRRDLFAERGQKLKKVGEDYINDISTVDPATILNSRTLGRDTLIRRRALGVFGEFTANYNDLLVLTVTGRNDQTSTLPKESRSFFYPSASLAFNFSELITKNNKIFSYGKLRGSIAETAKDIPPYGSQSVYNRQLTSGLGYGYGFTNNNPFIKPERQRTFEVGTELNFFGKRLTFDYTYYNTLNLGQIVRNVRLSYGSGFILSTLNVADTRNKGMELIVTGQPIKNKNFKWDITVNMAGTRNKVLNLPSNIPEYYNSDTWLDAFRNGLVPGSTTTSLTGQDYLRNSQGQILIDPGTGVPLVNPNYIKIAERNPDITGGIINSLTYKNVSLSFSLDLRKGGDIMNGTEYWLTLRGYSTRTLDREKSIILPGVLRDGLEETANPTPNTIQINPYFSTYYQDGRMYASNFVEKDINWLRLRETRVNYRFTPKMLKNMKYISALSLFVSGTDLFILTNYSGADPSVNGNNAATAGVGSFGIDYFSPSTPRGINFGLRADFKAR